MTQLAGALKKRSKQEAGKCFVSLNLGNPIHALKIEIFQAVEVPGAAHLFRFGWILFV